MMIHTDVESRVDPFPIQFYITAQVLEKNTGLVKFIFWNIGYIFPSQLTRERYYQLAIKADKRMKKLVAKGYEHILYKDAAFFDYDCSGSKPVSRQLLDKDGKLRADYKELIASGVFKYKEEKGG